MFKQMTAALRPLTGLLVLVGVLLSPLSVQANSIAGQCSDCHTMHNSEQSAPVARRGINGTIFANPLPNLLRYDCVACHAQDPEGPKITVLGGGSQVPQVYHGGTTDLAAGNFRYITEGGNRRGHNVRDLFAGGDRTGGSYNQVPGIVGINDNTWADDHVGMFAQGADPFGRFTCAGTRGCHGTRFTTQATMTGLRAVSGAHHKNQDGLKTPAKVNLGLGHNGATVAAGYRFIPGLKGYGNEVDRWQNVDADSHNEYYGYQWQDGPYGSSCCGTVFNAFETFVNDCDECHTQNVPDQSMSMFCITCHGNFHSGGGTMNSSGGAFLRHPSDYVIPNRGEYAAYNTFNITAPVARPAGVFDGLAGPLDTVTPGTDMVMCLSCHMAHASPYDGMLRFDYSQMVAGGYATNPGVGCLACHTNKGVANGD